MLFMEPETTERNYENLRKIGIKDDKIANIDFKL